MTLLTRWNFSVPPCEQNKENVLNETTRTTAIFREREIFTFNGD